MIYKGTTGLFMPKYSKELRQYDIEPISSSLLLISRLQAQINLPSILKLFCLLAVFFVQIVLCKAAMLLESAWNFHGRKDFVCFVIRSELNCLYLVQIQTIVMPTSGHPKINEIEDLLNCQNLDVSLLYIYMLSFPKD